MPSRIHSYIKFLVALSLIVSFCLVEGDAQTRRKKRSTRRAAPAAPKPVITNPSIAPPDGTKAETATGDVKIISTDDPAQEPTPSTDTKPAKPAASPLVERLHMGDDRRSDAAQVVAALQHR